MIGTGPSKPNLGLPIMVHLCVVRCPVCDFRYLSVDKCDQTKTMVPCVASLKFGCIMLWLLILTKANGSEIRGPQTKECNSHVQARAPLRGRGGGH